MKTYKRIRNVLGWAIGLLALASLAALYGVVWSILHAEPYNNWLVTLGINVGVISVLWCLMVWADSLYKKGQKRISAIREEARTKAHSARVRVKEETRQDLIDARVKTFSPEELERYEHARRDRSHSRSRW